MTSMLDTAFAHHFWANERLLDACAGLTDEQLTTPVPGTYGPIIMTLGHLVSSDGWYLSFFHDSPVRVEEDGSVSVADLRAATAANAALWMELLARGLDQDEDVVEHGEGWDFHAPTGLRLAQVVHHGTDHRSQVCTALTSLGITPPLIDLWDYGEALGPDEGRRAGARLGRRGRRELRPARAGSAARGRRGSGRARTRTRRRRRSARGRPRGSRTSPAR